MEHLSQQIRKWNKFRSISPVILVKLSRTYRKIIKKYKIIIRPNRSGKSLIIKLRRTIPINNYARFSWNGTWINRLINNSNRLRAKSGVEGILSNAQVVLLHRPIRWTNGHRSKIDCQLQQARSQKNWCLFHREEVGSTYTVGNFREFRELKQPCCSDWEVLNRSPPTVDLAVFEFGNAYTFPPDSLRNCRKCKFRGYDSTPIVIERVVSRSVAHFFPSPASSFTREKVFFLSFSRHSRQMTSKIRG